MEDKEILKRLEKLTRGNKYYFTKKLFKRDYKVFERRSFDDLFLYFRRLGVSERQLMRVLYSKESKFSGFVCGNINKFVLYKSKRTKTIWGINLIYQSYNYPIEHTKYTVEYLENLYASIYSNND
jgi:hypothetical protein